MNPISKDDPRVTAYALGELEGPGLAEVKAAVQADPALQAEVERIREMSQSLANALAAEASKELAGAAGVASDSRKRAGKRKGALSRKLLRFPQLYLVIGSLAAACFAVLVALHEPEAKHPVQKKEYMEVALPPLPAAGEATVAETGKDVEAPQMALPSAEGGMGERLSRRTAAQSVRKASPAEANRLAIVSMEKLHRSQMPRSSFSFGTEAPARSRFNTEAYAYVRDNGFIDVAVEPLSTFSVDVDTASYSNVRRFLENGQRPPRDAVRIEELVNYFPYRYALPSGSKTPFAVALEAAEAPWSPQHRLVRIGIQGREVSDAARPAVNLVFLLDVSGSMNEPSKLPLVKESMRLLVMRLRPDDRVAIVTYAGAAGLALPSTPVERRAEIIAAIDDLHAGGSTNGAQGIHLAYDVAKANAIAGGVSRVILCTDGDFNLGVTSQGELVRLIQEKAKGGMFLTVLGFGMGNLKDSTLEMLADKGNGAYGYIDTLAEARRQLVERCTGTLITIARDVKVQVEFNPAKVAAYRLIGYENRTLRREDFANDKVDAGEIGAGHTMTALYEVVPVGVAVPEPLASVEPLKYRKPEGEDSMREIRSPVLETQELLTVKLRYKEPDGAVSQRLEFPFADRGEAWVAASEDFKFAAAVASFGMILRESPYKGAATLAKVSDWAHQGIGGDVGGYRSEFLGLVKRAELLYSSAR